MPARSRATSDATAPAEWARLALVATVTPFLLRAPDNPGGLPLSVFDELRAACLADRAQTFRDLADGPFFGRNRPGADMSPGVRDAFWSQAMRSGHRNALECIKAFSETDFRDDLAAFDVPTLIVHGDDDQLVPLRVGGQASAAIVEDATLMVYEGAPHGITETHKARLQPGSPRLRPWVVRSRRDGLTAPGGAGRGVIRCRASGTPSSGGSRRYGS